MMAGRDVVGETFFQVVVMYVGPKLTEIEAKQENI